jgi:hypothetical protein
VIDTAIKFLTTQLNNHLSLHEEVAEYFCGPLHAGDGKTPDTPVVSLIAVEEERTTREQQPQTKTDLTTALTQSPPVKLNLHVVFAVPVKQPASDPASLEKTYLQSLRSISLVIAFFQSRPRFTAQEHAELATAGIDRLCMDLLTLTTEQLNQLWSYMGTRYMPSAVYRVRMLCLQAQQSSMQQPLVLHPSTNLGGD